ncbi:Ankyrin repeat and protein kinase domain-containing protein 1 [Hondaea fermentalgiana]|uniref:Ankyrin repeat and protein kinase domain-containing protein 1 n=1 Tax=Hondaea fermentalgiana TaxID=2315210 RepID=A0A2R5GC72_9STRA|nr:Ankyrin repeat and protein kinase domain-containing protein 1 [Hondaea fermentalgiana]|eukprot:GBG25354.1 Ankyrin repeat and protein kinase domain-containing protein 1 [Hondaea fermentalgiana]
MPTTKEDVMRKLIDAVEEDDEAAVKKMLKVRGADINGCLQGGYSPMHAAARHGLKEMIKFLLDNGADVDLVTSQKKLETPLHVACHQGQLGCAKTLVRSGASLKAKTKQNRTPLEVAEFRGHDDIVEYLEGKGVRDAKAAKKKLKAMKKKKKKRSKKSKSSGSLAGILMPLLFLLFLVVLINLIGS